MYHSTPPINLFSKHFFSVSRYIAMRRYRKHTTKRGGFLPLIPLLAAAIPAIASTVASGIDIAQKVKQMKGQGVRRYKKHVGGKVRKRNIRRYRGRGLASDIAGMIPLLGPILKPIVSSFGGRVHRLPARRGMGLSNLRIEGLNQLAGGALMPHHMMPMPLGGLLAPAGGRVKHVRGHYRRVKKGGAIHRIRVRAHKKMY